MKQPATQIANKLSRSDRKELLRTGELRSGEYRLVADNNDYKIIRRIQR